VTPVEIAATGKWAIKGIDGRWPPPPEPKEIVFFGGFPGNERDIINPNDVVFGLHSVMPGLTSFTDRQLCCQLDRSSWIDIRGLGLPPVGSSATRSCKVVASQGNQQREVKVAYLIGLACFFGMSVIVVVGASIFSRSMS
jgi:hypothetical protein